MKTREEVIEFAEMSAAMAADQFSSQADAVENYRDNLIDTMNEWGVTCQFTYRDALAVYDAGTRQCAKVDDAHIRKALALLDFIRKDIASNRGLEWHDKHIHPCKAESFQQWVYELPLSVPLGKPDKSPLAAFERFLDGLIRA